MSRLEGDPLPAARAAHSRCGQPARWRHARAARGLVAVALLAAAAATGCGRGEERERRLGSALWVDGAAEPLSVSDWKRLEGAGLSELFVAAATVTWAGSSAEVAPLTPVRPPGGARAMLVASGEWPVGLADPEAAGASLADRLGSVRRVLEESGWAVAGWHLDLDGAPSPELVESLRSALEPRLLLSATVPRERLADEALGDLLAATDFVVVFLYGAREDEPDRDEAWDFRQVERDVKALEALEEPYLVGAVVRGTVAHLRHGELVAELPGVSLGDLAWHRGLRLREGFSLTAIDRQVYEFGAPAATRLGAVRLATGDTVRVAGTSSAHLQELRKQLAGWGPRSRLGELYYRLPHPGEVVSLGPEHLLHAAGSERPRPLLQITVTPLATARGRVVVRVTLDNASGEPTDIALVDANFVEVRATGGSFGDVEEGEFHRFDIYAPDERGELRRSFRNPTVLRLFAPLVGPEISLHSGPIEVKSAGELGDLQVSASFLTPYGGNVELPPRSWTELAPRPTPTPTPSP